jgi:hypothetical protein
MQLTIVMFIYGFCGSKYSDTLGVYLILVTEFSHYRNYHLTIDELATRWPVQVI